MCTAKTGKEKKGPGWPRFKTIAPRVREEEGLNRTQKGTVAKLIVKTHPAGTRRPRRQVPQGRGGRGDAFEQGDQSFRRGGDLQEPFKLTEIRERAPLHRRIRGGNRKSSSRTHSWVLRMGTYGPMKKLSLRLAREPYDHGVDEIYHLQKTWATVLG